ncbi:hypothetical protein VTL71DRAFT_11168 [Oculimacula yallundae]|uniref:Uncharacterized protein n=1 Tax=Oculimacula yallundae TaxID=86028 RepID=A0ABR4CVI7_9HELO
MATEDSSTQLSKDTSSKLEGTAHTPPLTGSLDAELTINRDYTTPNFAPSRVMIPRAMTERLPPTVKRSEGLVQDQKFRCYRCSFVLDEENKCIDDDCGADSTRVVTWVSQLPENYEIPGENNLGGPEKSEGKTVSKYRKQSVKFAVGDEPL